MNRMIAIEERASLSNALEFGPAYDRATDAAAHSSGRVPDDNAVRMTAIALNRGLLIRPRFISAVYSRPTRAHREAFLVDWD